MCVCVCVWGGGGYTDIFIYIRRLLNFNIFFFFFFFFLGGGGGSEISLFLGNEDFVDVSLQNWTGFRGHFYTFQGFFLRSMCRMGILFG